MSETESQKEDRQRRRNRVLWKGTIIRGVNQSETVCVVRNISSSGARLKVGIDQHVPEEFLLSISHGENVFRCRVSWRAGTDVGVVFLGTEVKPRWHYG